MPKITRRGNSIVVALPRLELSELGLKPGDEVIVRRRGSVLEIVPAELSPRLVPRSNFKRVARKVFHAAP